MTLDIIPLAQSLVSTTSYDFFGGRVYCVRREERLLDKENSYRQLVKEQVTYHLLHLLNKVRGNGQLGRHARRMVITLAKTSLGKPILVTPSRMDVSISFSYGYRDIWGAICECPLRCGVDIASVEDFDHKFPVAKVFSPEEFQAGSLIEGDRNSLMALLWSAKESIVKAAGCGFHLIPPCFVKLRFVPGSGDLIHIECDLPMRSGHRDIHYSTGKVGVVSFACETAWVSVALSQEAQPDAQF